MADVQVINFRDIPTPWEVPGNFIEVQPGYQFTGILPIPARTLIIGGRTTAGTAAAGAVIQNVTRTADARAYGGHGSHIDTMARAYLAVNRTIPLDIVGVDDVGGVVNAAWTYTFAGTATAGGTVASQAAGERVAIGVVTGDTAAALAIEFGFAVNAIPDISVVANVAGSVVTLTALNKGTCGNDLTFLLNPASGDGLPPGITVTVVQSVTGTTNPSIAAALTAVSQTWYTDIVIAWRDTTNIGLLNAELERRWNAMVHKDGRGHIGITGSFSQQIAAAAAANARFIHFSGMVSPGSPPWAVAASAAGVCARRLTEDPARQLRGLEMPGIIGPQPANLPDDFEKQLLLAAGVSVFHTLRDGTVTMERYVSTYTVNGAGNLDPAWHDVLESAVASRIRYDRAAYFALLYPANKLANDGSLAASADTTVITPGRAKASWGARMMVYARSGWVVDEIAQARAAVFFIDPNDPNRLNSRMPYTRIGNLIVDAGQIVFNVGGE